MNSKVLARSSFLRYMLHLICFDFIDQTALNSVVSGWSVPLIDEFSYFLLSFVFAYAAASLSWFLVEQPILGMKRYRAQALST
jgi:peptidoglycan/LPS O-acetylase OafA/YrhL